MATISTNAETFSGDLIAVVLSLIAVGGGLAVLIARRRPIAETTLVSSWWWALAAIIDWSGVEMLAACGLATEAVWLQPLRLAAVALSFCPAVSLIGAKRPQHTAWNFVVLSLWAIVVLPAAETFFLRRGQALEMGDARGWFLWILILLGPVNFLPTRFWLAILLLAAGQILALGSFLPLIHRPLAEDASLLGLLLAAGALGAAWLAGRHDSKAANPNDRLWLDFRDSFGLFWSLRVQERVNAAAKQYGWSIDLSWSGFRDQETGQPIAVVDASIEPEFRTSLKGLLRRFVSHRWIAERLPEGID